LGGPKKAEPAVKKRLSAETDGPQKKKAKPAADKPAKPAAAKKTPGVGGKAKAPGTGAPRPAAAKKEKGATTPKAKKAPVRQKMGPPTVHSPHRTEAHCVAFSSG
jgi:hypothetical protein